MRGITRTFTLAACALVALAAAPAEAPSQLAGIGVHVLPAFATVNVGKNITVQNDEPFDVDVVIRRVDTSKTVFSGTVDGHSSQSWLVDDSLGGLQLGTHVYYAGTTDEITSHTHRVIP